MRSSKKLVIAMLLAVSAMLAYNAFGGKLYIKPELERNRAARLLSEADADFRNGKIHITLSPEISVTEFQLAKEKYKQAVELIEIYGAGYYSPGDIEDYNNKTKECDIWIRKSSQEIKQKKANSNSTVF